MSIFFHITNSLLIGINPILLADRPDNAVHPCSVWLSQKLARMLHVAFGLTGIAAVMALPYGVAAEASLIPRHGHAVKHQPYLFPILVHFPTPPAIS